MALSSSQVRTGDSQSSNRGSNPRSATKAPIAQLDRASDYGSEGWGFKSSWAHFTYTSFLSPMTIGLNTNDN